jgi:hypothetical protein
MDQVTVDVDEKIAVRFVEFLEHKSKDEEGVTAEDAERRGGGSRGKAK